MLLTLKVIALAVVWIGAIVAVCIAVSGVLSLVASVVPAVATVVVTVALVAGACVGIGKAASLKL
jgi:hypothetical protein